MYKVVGKLDTTDTVIDRLILTSINSVLEIHGLKDIKDNDGVSHHYESEDNDKNKHKEKK